MLVDFDVIGQQQGMDFFNERSIIMDSYFSYYTVLMDLLETQLFDSQDINWLTGVVRMTCGLLWCFYQLFGLSFWRHPFTAEDPLVSKWCNATFLQICSDEETLIYILDGLRVSIFQLIFFFWGELFL